MPSNLDYLREYTGTAGDQMLVADITAAALVLTIDGASGWPTGAHPFIITINAGSSNEEKVLVTTRTGNTLSLQQRGFDGTPASTHSAGEKVQHTDSAYDFTLFNAHGSSSSGVHDVAGNVVGDTDPMTLSNKVLVQPEIDDLTLMQHDHSSAAEGGSAGLMLAPGAVSGMKAHQSGAMFFTYATGGVAVAHGASFTPTFANVMMVDWLTTWTSVQVLGVDATNVTFRLFNGSVESSAGNCHARLLVFA
jgi:hypothetical protein